MQIEDSMIAIDVADVVNGASLPSDVYVKLNDDKFVLVAKAGDKAQLSSISGIESQQIKQIYVRKEDWNLFFSQAINLVEHAKKKKKSIRTEHETYFLKSASSAIFKQIEVFGASKESIEHAKSVADHTLTMIEKQPSLAAVLRGLQLASPSMVNHSTAVSAFSVMMARQMGWQSKVTLEKLALGGLLAEIGLKELPPELIEKPRAEMTYEERQLYEEHPYRGLKMLETVGIVPDDVLSIIYEHHENSSGMGYPRKLRELRQNPLAKVVALATQFCELTVKTPVNPDPRPVDKALAYIHEIMGQPFNREAFKALKDLVEADKRS